MRSSRFYYKAGILAALLGYTSVSHTAPIRVGIFKSVGQGKYFHTSIHTAGSALVTLLANPSAADLGPNLIVPTNGFSVTLFGTPDTVQNGRPATDAEQTAFISALDTLDVVVFPNITDFGGSMPDTSRRSKLLKFLQTKGAVSIHGSIDTYGTWRPWDSIHGTRFNAWTTTTPQATVHLDTVSKGDPGLRFLNRGLPDTARFSEEWMSFTTTGSTIRAQTGLKVSVRLNEASVSGGLSTHLVMGDDHPMSWYRELSGGGRFFFTALGHRSQNYTGLGTYDNSGNLTTPGTNYVRRTLYNAILWAAGADTNGVVGIGPGGATRMGKAPEVRVSRSEVSVQITEQTPYHIDIHTLEGKRVASRNGGQAGNVVFKDLKPHAVYLVTVTTPHSRTARRILLD